MSLKTLCLTNRPVAAAARSDIDDFGRHLAVRTQDLTKRYGGRALAVDHLNLRLRRGEVYGLLGANGAGKTTTLRMLLGLTRPTSGSAIVLGGPPGSPESLAGLGALVEQPAFYPYLSGRDNLRVLALHGGVARQRVEAVLEQVHLAGRAGDAFRIHSMGMKQRLGVAAALLKDPELLILDEPTNGLDPSGMSEMRVLIRSLGRENRTVLLSSHLMAEVEQICDRVGVIQGGRLIAEGTIEELRGQGCLRVRAHPVEAARQVVCGVEGVVRVEMVEDTLRIIVDPALAPQISRALSEAGVELIEMYRERESLETVFLGLTNNKEGENDVE